MGYDDLKVIEAALFLGPIVDGEQREPGVREALAAANVIAALERSAGSGAGSRSATSRSPPDEAGLLGDSSTRMLGPPQPTGARRGRSRAPPPVAAP